MQELIAALVYGGSGSVEAVEALLILAEWVPRRPQSAPSIGKGEEDHQAWMLIGTAVRLGYLLELDRTGFRTAVDPPQSSDFNRKRLAWSGMLLLSLTYYSNLTRTNSVLHDGPTCLCPNWKSILE